MRCDQLHCGLSVLLPLSFVQLYPVDIGLRDDDGGVEKRDIKQMAWEMGLEWLWLTTLWVKSICSSPLSHRAPAHECSTWHGRIRTPARRQQAATFCTPLSPRGRLHRIVLSLTHKKYCQTILPHSMPPQALMVISKRDQSMWLIRKEIIIVGWAAIRLHA